MFSSILVVQEEVLVNLKSSFQVGRNLEKYKLKSSQGTATLLHWQSTKKIIFDALELMNTHFRSHPTKILPTTPLTSLC